MIQQNICKLIALIIFLCTGSATIANDNTSQTEQTLVTIINLTQHTMILTFSSGTEWPKLDQDFGPLELEPHESYSLILSPKDIEKYRKLSDKFSCFSHPLDTSPFLLAQCCFSISDPTKPIADLVSKSIDVSVNGSNIASWKFELKAGTREINIVDVVSHDKLFPAP